MNNCLEALREYELALKAEKYTYRLVNPESGKVKLGEYTGEQLVKSEKYFKALNTQGFNIYCRPIGYQYVLLDDLNLETLTDLAVLRPCLLIETSPNNFQAWLILHTIPESRETAKSICKELAKRLNADLASAEPDHVGRLPGFTNRKEKHRLPNGLFPFVKLRRAQHRISTFYPSGGAVLQSSGVDAQLAKPLLLPSKGSISEQDFGQACQLIRAGKGDDDIFEYLLRNSPNLEQRKGHRHINRYLQRTINEARRRVNR